MIPIYKQLVMGIHRNKISKTLFGIGLLVICGLMVTCGPDTCRGDPLCPRVGILEYRIPNNESGAVVVFVFVYPYDIHIQVFLVTWLSGGFPIENDCLEVFWGSTN